MSSEGSVTRWLIPLQGGDPNAVQQLWQRYFHRLVGLARTRLVGAARRVADEEDVALSAFDSFCRNAEQGRFPDLADRDGLWRLLVVLTARKAGHLRRDQTRLKRGGGGQIEAGPDDRDLIQEVLSREPDPAFAALAADQHRHLMGLLNDELREVAQARLQGESVEEIAAKLGVVARSIKRKLALIRQKWESDLEE
jgi:DNA-directed RNA polymerase specialized sigma24 family protein